MLSNYEIYHLLNKLEGCARKFGEGEYLFKSGQDPNCLILLTSGKLLLESENGYTRSGLDKLGAERKVWGLKEILMNKNYEFTGVASSNADCYLIDKEKLIEKTKADPVFKFNLMTHIAREFSSIGATFE